MGIGEAFPLEITAEEAEIGFSGLIHWHVPLQMPEQQFELSVQSELIGSQFA